MCEEDLGTAKRRRGILQCELFTTMRKNSVEIVSVLRILQDVVRLPQEIWVTVDFPTLRDPLYVRRSGFRYSVAHQQTIMLSLSILRLKVQSLKIDEYTFRHSDDLLAYNRADLLASMSTLRTLHFEGEVPHADMPIYDEILRGASDLRSLTFDSGGQRLFNGKQISMMPLAPELLLTNELSSLTSLKITKTVLDGASFIQALRRCQGTLTHLVLRYVALSTNDEDLIPVHQAMLEMPEPVFLELQLLQARNFERHVFFAIPNDGVRPEGQLYEGKESIKEWLQDLLDNHLYLHHKPEEPEGD